MAFTLATSAQWQASTVCARFDPRFWTVNFSRPMMAAVTTLAPDALRVDMEFQTLGDLNGLIWSSADTIDHPLLAYQTNVNYSGCVLSFRWQSSGIIPLDGTNGPTLTIDGFDTSGNPAVWYIRLWNYMTSGTNTDAVIVLPFDTIQGGWAPTIPINPANITSMFLSMCPVGYVANSTTPLAAPVDAWVLLTSIAASGAGATLPLADAPLAQNGLAMATGYDDQYNVTPASMVRQIVKLGYAGSVDHYIGMSHYFRLTNVAGPNGQQQWLAGQSAQVLCTPCQVWHADYFARLVAAGLSPIVAQSLEVLAQNCPAGWYQQDLNGNQSLTGWSPPSTLLSPCNATAMAYSEEVAEQFVAMLVAAGAKVRFQVGEWWWWVNTATNAPCLYDAAAKAALGGPFGGNLPAIADMTQTMNAGQTALLVAAGQALAQAIGAICQAVRNAAVSAAVRNAAGSAPVEILSLIFTPTVLSSTWPALRYADMPEELARPAFDRLQVEDYDWLTGGAAYTAQRQAAYATVNAALRYPADQQDYYAGYVPPGDAAAYWPLIDAGIDEARQRGPHEIFVWALPEVIRDGYVRLPDQPCARLLACDCH